MTTAAYNYLSPVGPWPFKITTTDTVNPGDLLKWDSGTKTIRPLTVASEGDLMVGVAMGQYPPSSNIDNGTVSPPPFVSTAIDGLFSFYGTASETLTMFDALYLGADSQTLVKAAPGGTDTADILGYFWPDDGADKVVAAGDRIQVRLRVNTPTPNFAA